MVLLKAVAASDNSTAVPRILKRSHSLQRRGRNSRRLLWLCCVAPPLADDFSALPPGPHPASEHADMPHLQPVLLSKGPAPALVSSPESPQPQQLQQGLVLISANSSPTGVVRLLPTGTPADPHEATLWQQQQQQLLQNHEQFAHYARFSIDVHTLASGQSSTAAEVSVGASGAESCVKLVPVQPLTHDSLPAAAVAAAATAGGLSAAEHAAVRLAGTSQPAETTRSPSDSHSDTQGGLREPGCTVQVLSTSSSGSSSSCATHPHSPDVDQPFTISPPLSPTCHSTAGLQQLLAPAATTDSDVVQAQCSSSLAPCGSSSHHTSHSPVAGWDDDLLTPLAAADYEPSPAAEAEAGRAAAVAQAARAAAATACDGDLPAGGDSPHAESEACEGADGLNLPPGLASKLRKLDSGSSFRMLQPGLSDSFKASDCPPGELTGSGSSCTTPAAAAASDSLSGSGSVSISRRSSVGCSPRALHRASLSHGVTGAGEGQVPATIPEHTVSMSGTSGGLVSTSAAVAVAFEADAAALKDLVEAAAAAAPQCKPQHSRSKSAGVLGSPMPDATSAAAVAADAAPGAAPGTGTGVAAPAARGLTAAATAAQAAAAVALPHQCAVPRTLSLSNSPFAQVDLQQAVTASLMTNRQHTQQQQQQQQLLASNQAKVSPPDDDAAAGAASMAGPAAASSASPAAMANAAGRASSSSSSSFRSLSHALSVSNLQLQQQRQHGSPFAAEQRSMKPSMASKLSWASAVTVFEPQAQVFALLNPEDAASTENPVSTEVSTPGRILRHSKSMSSLSSLRKGVLARSNSSSTGSSSGRGGAGRPRAGRGLWGLVRARSSGSFFAGLRGPSKHQRLAAAAAAAAEAGAEAAKQPEAGSIPASHTVGGGDGSSSSSGGSSIGSSKDTNPAASAPNGHHVLRSIVRRPSRTSSNSRPDRTCDTVSPTPTAAGAAQCKQTGTRSSLDLQQWPSAGGSRSKLVDVSSSQRHVPALPPLPRPASSPCTDAAAAAIAQHTAASSSYAAAPQAAAALRISSEGPFSVQHGLLLEDATPAGSGSVLSSSGKYGLRRAASAASAPTQLLRETRSTGASSIGQLSSSGSSSGTGGSLMSLAVTRMHSAAGSTGNLVAAGSTAAAAQQSQLSPQRSSSLPSLSSVAAAATNTTSSSTAVARAFAEAFIAALMAGDTKWAASTTVSQLLHESAKMVGLDKQLYVGKTAIIRRLNGGMEQLVKMAQATTADSSNSSSNSSNGSSSSHTDSAGVVSASPQGDIAALAQKLPTPQLSVTSPDPKGKPSQVEAVYTFKWGIRKFTLRDSFIVREGQILRLRRTRG